MIGKVLVADDNLNVQRSVAAALKAEDIEVVAVSHGEAAVRKIPEVKPDLILADVFMPVRTGFEVCEFVKSDPNLAHIPVLLLVGQLEPLDEKEVGRVRADGFLKKPFESAQLISTVKSYLSKIVRKPTAEMQAAAQEFAAAIPVEVELPAEEAQPIEPFSSRPEPVEVNMPESERPLAFGEMLSEGPAPAEQVAPGSVEAMFGAAPPAEEAAGGFGGFGSFEAQPEAPAEEPAPPAFEAAPAFEASAQEAAPSFEPAAPAPSAPEELLVEKEAQAWELPASTARDPMLADSMSDFMASSPRTDLPTETPWEVAPMVTEAPPEFAAEAAPVETAPAEAAEGFAPAEPTVDPALVDAVVQQVMERLTPQIVEAVARDLVRPLAESLLREKLGQ